MDDNKFTELEERYIKLNLENKFNDMDYMNLFGTDYNFRQEVFTEITLRKEKKQDEENDRLRLRRNPFTVEDIKEAVDTLRSLLKSKDQKIALQAAKAVLTGELSYAQTKAALNAERDGISTDKGVKLNVVDIDRDDQAL